MPAGATFNRLHDVIRNLTNFESGYPYEDYYFFEFELPNENIRVTNNEYANQEHLNFKKNHKAVEERIKSSPPVMTMMR